MVLVLNAYINIVGPNASICILGKHSNIIFGQDIFIPIVSEFSLFGGKLADNCYKNITKQQGKLYLQHIIFRCIPLSWHNETMDQNILNDFTGKDDYLPTATFVGHFNAEVYLG